MATWANIERYTVDELCDYVSNKWEMSFQDVQEILDELRSNNITGRSFLELTDDELKEMIKPIGDRKALKGILTSYTSQITTVRQYYINGNMSTCIEVSYSTSI